MLMFMLMLTLMSKCEPALKIKDTDSLYFLCLWIKKIGQTPAELISHDFRLQLSKFETTVGQRSSNQRRNHACGLYEYMK